MSNVSGLLTQKPDSPAPEPGETRRFSVEQREKKNKPGETWNKLKNEGEGYGQAFKVLKADKTDFTDNHGNVSYSVLCESLDPSGTPVSAAVGASNGSDPRGESIDRAVAFKGAVELVAAGIQEGKLEPEAATTAIRSLTTALLPIVKGQSDPPAEPAESGTNLDADIPF